MALWARYFFQAVATTAVVLPLRAGLFNIGAEGQIYLGALFATYILLRVLRRALCACAPVSSPS